MIRIVLVGGLLCGLAGLTARAVTPFESDEHLWVNASQSEPLAPRPYLWVAAVRMAQGNYPASERLLNKAFFLTVNRPQNEQAQFGDAIISNLAILRVQAGNISQAVLMLRGAPEGSTRLQVCRMIPQCVLGS